MYRITFALGDTTGAPHGVAVSSAYAAGAPGGPAHYQLGLVRPADQLGEILATLVRADELYLRAHPSLPSVRQSGVAFALDPQGASTSDEECWQDVPTCLALRKGGNRDLAAWRCAELRVRQGVDARPMLAPSPGLDGKTQYRAVVWTPQGVEDPSQGRGAWPVSRVHRVAVFLNLFNGPQERLLSNETLQALLDGLAAVDEDRLRSDPTIPLLYRSGVVYQEEPPGQEDWQDLPWTLRLGYGDCLPTTTRVIRKRIVNERFVSGEETVSIARLEPGDLIRGDEGRWTMVTAAAVTGWKPILKFVLSNGEALRCSPEHRLLLDDHTEVRAERLLVGERLRSPSKAPVVVVAKREEPVEVCADVATDTGRFYLPESDVVVHNCEDLACWRAAELRVRFGIDARPTFTSQVRKDGTYLYHILVALPDGRIEDPSRNLGMR